MTAVFGVTGWKDSGKTTLVAALVQEFTKRGLRVSTIKHAHSGFDIDQEGTDSHTHRMAGAQEVAIVSDRRWALIREVKSSGETPSLDTMLSKLGPCDLVLVEGFKSSDIAKIECCREPNKETPLWQTNNSIVALATEKTVEECTLPQFPLDDVSAIADYIAQTTGLGLS